jgi:peptidoglycan hydrolase-like protein with peptidoglycan-binding domain
METLRINAQNNDNVMVTYLQKKLNIEQTGIFDVTTDNAVKNFQTANGLVSDGIVGGHTWTKIYLNTEIPRQVTTKLERTNNILHLHPLVRTAVVKTFVRYKPRAYHLRYLKHFVIQNVKTTCMHRDVQK